MPNQHCKKECEKPCKVKRFSSWSESSEHCGKPTCEQREVIIKEVCCEEKKCCNRRYGYKIKQETPWRPVCCHDNKYGKKCDCKKDNKYCDLDCPKPCKEKKYDCWSESSEHCEKPKCQERCVIVKEVRCKENKDCNRRCGHKELIEKPFKPIPCDNGNKYVEKKCDKKKCEVKKCEESKKCEVKKCEVKKCEVKKCEKKCDKKCEKKKCYKCKH